MLGQPSEIGVGSGTGQDLGILFSDSTSALTFERLPDHGRASGRAPRLHCPVHELHELVRKAHGYLLAHTKTVANRYQRARPLTPLGSTLQQESAGGLYQWRG
jgi:hypothetical protein